ncbi:hypothetical protein QYE76_001141 [Lolium multiflorum]|uniref:Uncharacterized protein n=1 Tax=Lolium multiflorum TaxID=4521 RepID=A0AAD8RIY2_LOLMU|nr:hypothetical protein QYE76_001141 [Lolium multiflorum]
MRRFSEPKRKAIGEEVSRLRKAGFIRELKEAEWVANPVMVPKKKTTALRMCIDYMSLNKHCPKDHFPLPRSDQIVDSIAGCDRLSFLDAYSGYNQIKLKKEDQELTAFITPHGVFCYNVMTFGLKNAGATYQRCMQACLGEQIGRNIEVYIDDIVVKTKHAATLIDDLRETFDNLDRYKINLNPKKCFFGVPGGQVLGYFISARGIEENPLKIKAILDMEPPKNLHQVQQLAGRLAALSRFIAKLGEKALPFYNLMKKYEALLHGMKMAKACGATRLEIYGDSNLVVQQSMNLCDAVSDNMISYHQLYQNMEAKFEGCELKHIGRASNKEADALANIGSMCSPIPDGVFYKVITTIDKGESIGISRIIG